MKKRRKMLALAMALGICMSMTSFAIGEEEAPAAVEQTQEAAQLPEAPAVEAEQTEVAREDTHETAQSPAEAAPAPEQTKVESAAPADGSIEIEDAQTPLGLFNPQSAFTGVAVVERKGEGALYYGDQVTLTAKVYGANRAFQIRWEVDCHDEYGWRPIYGENELDYDFVLTPETAAYDYRVVLVTEP